MVEEYEKGKKKRHSIMRSLADYVMGGFFVILGFFFFFRDKFKLDFNEIFPPNYVDLIFGGICIVYGTWRIYRGYKKNYFK
jgi:hypothetical protein